MPTIHFNAPDNAFADTVLFPGDPLRAKYIAERFLENPQEISNVRNMLAFTGDFNGHRISVSGSGMGIPSASIYAKELITDYGVKKIIRVGSCGAVRDDVNLRDVIIAVGAGTDSNVNRLRFDDFDFPAVADFDLVERAVAAARSSGAPYHVGPIFSSDLFYHPKENLFALLDKYRILGVEMEAAGLYGVAAEFGARALAICTVSDHIKREEALTSDERQASFDQMISIALQAAL